MVEIVKILRNDLYEFSSNPFAKLNLLEGTVYRLQPGRKTIAFDCQGKTYFAKLHYGVGWKEIVKNILQLRWPIISAEPEWRALLRLEKLGIKAPAPVAFGKRGINPARLQSFIITEAILSTINLEEFFSAQPQLKFSVKKRLIESVAQIAKTLHDNGINHRDFYLCHFLLNESSVNGLNPEIYLIDLHRAECRRKVPFRWRLKDIAGLYFSTLGFTFTKQDYFRFIRCYTGQPLRITFKRDKLFWRRVSKKAHKLYRKIILAN